MLSMYMGAKSLRAMDCTTAESFLALIDHTGSVNREVIR